MEIAMSLSIEHRRKAMQEEEQSMGEHSASGVGLNQGTKGMEDFSGNQVKSGVRARQTREEAIATCISKEGGGKATSVRHEELDLGGNLIESNGPQHCLSLTCLTAQLTFPISE